MGWNIFPLISDAEWWSACRKPRLLTSCERDMKIGICRCFNRPFPAQGSYLDSWTEGSAQCADASGSKNRFHHVSTETTAAFSRVLSSADPQTFLTLHVVSQPTASPPSHGKQPQQTNPRAAQALPHTCRVSRPFRPPRPGYTLPPFMKRQSQSSFPSEWNDATSLSPPAGDAGK